MSARSTEPVGAENPAPRGLSTPQVRRASRPMFGVPSIFKRPRVEHLTCPSRAERGHTGQWGHAIIKRPGPT